MKIVGLDSLIFGLDDVPGAARFLIDYGLTPVDVSDAGGRFEAMDGTSVVIARDDNPRLPAAPASGCRLRKTVMGVADSATLQAIEAELRRDREVRSLPDGSIESIDDSNFVIGFRVTARRPFVLPGEVSNAPGGLVFRPVNSLGVPPPGTVIRPRSLSHVVYFVPDVLKAEAFYVNRLGFRCTDRFTATGPFLQPARVA